MIYQNSSTLKKPTVIEWEDYTYPAEVSAQARIRKVIYQINDESKYYALKLDELTSEYNSNWGRSRLWIARGEIVQPRSGTVEIA